jgi:hypothetical protein
LGNQLFTYAAGRAVADRLEVELHADMTKLMANDSRAFELATFASRIDRIHVSNPNAGGDKIMPHLGNRVRSFLRLTVPEADSRIVRERGFWFDPLITQVPDNSTIDGYLQSWKYFESAKAVLRKEIRSVTSPSPWFIETRETLTSLGQWVGIHVRRGDYVAIDRMGLTTNTYFERAINLLSRASPAPISAFVVFSDDVPAAMRLPALRELRDCIYIESPPVSRPIETLNLMGESAHLIMSNSSFSWWAAWLGERDGRLVVYPHPWIDYKFINIRDLPLPSWIGLGRDDHPTAQDNNVGY